MSWQISVPQLGQILGTTPTGATSHLNQEIIGISTDTRTLRPGEIFVALRGENFDGHNFIEAAIERGAAALITDRQSAVEWGNVPQLRVEDTLVAYQKIARWWRDRFDIPVIAVTGSVGKTTTKELIAAVLGTAGKVLKTEANYNNEIGVPKTLFNLRTEHDYAVIEMAMRAKGEIALLTQIARPTIGLITNVGTAHIGRLGSEEAIAQAKCELLAEMPDESVAVLNHDNQRLMDTAATVWHGKTVTYGLEGGDISGKLLNTDTIRIEGVELPLPLPGRHNALNYLAAIAVAKILKIDLTSLQRGLAVDLPKGRSRRYQLPNEIVILDETYNAGVESMVAALHLLQETPAQRHLAVLGTMKELGERSPSLHYQVGETVRQLGIDYLFVLVDEPETAAILEGASGIPGECFAYSDALLRRLGEIVQPGDCILFKASNSVGLSRVVEQFRRQVQINSTFGLVAIQNPPSTDGGQA